MAHDSNVKELQDKIFKLASDNLHLEEEKPPVTERIVEVPPSDYQFLKQKNQLDSQLIHQLQHRCHTLEHMLTAIFLLCLTSLKNINPCPTFIFCN